MAIAVAVGVAVAAASPAPAVPDPPAPAAAAPPRRARIWLGGDVHLDRRSAPAALAALPPLVAGAIGIVNLEGPIAPAPRARSGAGVKLVNPAGAVDGLRRAGVGAVGIANNHAGDAGPDGAASTARALRAGGLTPVGGPAGAGVLLVGGLRVAVTAHAVGRADVDVPATLVAELERARGDADVLVATFHATDSPSYLPGPALRRAVEAALAAGASVVAVHGSHMVGPVERRGAAVIAWGLGNLAFACACTRESEAIVLEVELGPEGAGRAAVIPIEAGLRGRPAAASREPSAIFDLLRAAGSSPLRPASSSDRAEL